MLDKFVSALLTALVAALCFAGCTKYAPGDAEKTKETAKLKKTETKHQHVHGEWWCDEHGVPEEICARCKPELVAQFKSKSDWCDKHDRPRSQCFICEPKLFEKYAAQYEAKYGKKPSRPTED